LTDSLLICYILRIMFNLIEKDLRGQGKGDLADAVKALHKLNGADIPLPGKEGVNFVRFSVEQRKNLERKGYLVYSLTGQTIATLRDAGHPFWSTWHQGEAIEQVRSLLTEVAVNPKSLFLQDSNRKTLDEQLAAVEKFRRKLSGEVKGVTAILGTAPDYAELVFSHLSATGKRLFGKDYDYDYTRTTTPTGESDVAIVGDFAAGTGLARRLLGSERS
jgi:hypothetical protein